MTMNRRSMLVGAGSALILSGAPVLAWSSPRVIAGPAFGTSWRVTLPEGTPDAPIATAIRDVVDSVGAAMSPYRPDSEVSRFNASDTRDWQPMSPQVCAVVRESLDVAALTAGAFDPTVGPIVARYGFGPIRRQGNGSYLNISARKDSLKKDDSGLSLDLCGIAKGHALDRMVAALDNLGVANFLIEFGGEVFARGRHSGGRAWQVGVERPFPGATTFQRIVRLTGQGLATSGDAVHSYTIAGRRYSHIIDPHHREPVVNSIASVSVLMPSVATADALATALMVMGPQAGAALAERKRIPALFIVREGAGLREIMTAGFAEAVIV